MIFQLNISPDPLSISFGFDSSLFKIINISQSDEISTNFPSTGITYGNHHSIWPIDLSTPLLSFLIILRNSIFVCLPSVSKQAKKMAVDLGFNTN